VQNEILTKNPKAKVRVFAVWLPVLGGDSKDGWDPKILNDPRVTNYWDADQTVSLWFGKNVIHSQGIVWDHYILFGPAATWDTAPRPVIGDGGDVISVVDQLEAQIGPFLN
jgi:hypothetical protein